MFAYNSNFITTQLQNLHPYCPETGAFFPGLLPLLSVPDKKENGRGVFLVTGD